MPGQAHFDEASRRPRVRNRAQLNSRPREAMCFPPRTIWPPTRSRRSVTHSRQIEGPPRQVRNSDRDEDLGRADNALVWGIILFRKPLAGVGGENPTACNGGQTTKTGRNDRIRKAVEPGVEGPFQSLR